MQQAKIGHYFLLKNLVQIGHRLYRQESFYPVTMSSKTCIVQVKYYWCSSDGTVACARTKMHSLIIRVHDKDCEAITKELARDLHGFLCEKGTKNENVRLMSVRRVQVPSAQPHPRPQQVCGD